MSTAGVASLSVGAGVGVGLRVAGVVVVGGMRVADGGGEGEDVQLATMSERRMRMTHCPIVLPPICITVITARPARRIGIARIPDRNWQSANPMSLVLIYDLGVEVQMRTSRGSRVTRPADNLILPHGTPWIDTRAKAAQMCVPGIKAIAGMPQLDQIAPATIAPASKEDIATIRRLDGGAYWHRIVNGFIQLSLVGCPTARSLANQPYSQIGSLFIAQRLRAA